MWILLLGPNGFRRVSENTPYRLLPGEQVYGSAKDETEEALHQELAKEGLQLGDVIKAVIKTTKLDKALGKQNCTACSERQRILNEARQLGVKETVKRLIGTFKNEESR